MNIPGLTPPLVEICCGCILSARNVAEVQRRPGRIELCQGLEIGGLTPSYEAMRYAIHDLGLPVNVLIRPRGGDYVYHPDEVRQMAGDIEIAAKLGAKGVVIGALTEDGDVNLYACRYMIERAKERGLSVTFHRAFDVCRDPLQALEDIMMLGCDRLLTSGHAPTAMEGLALIKRLMHQAGDDIIIMPGSGVTPNNVGEIIRRTRCREIHGSCKSPTPRGVEMTDPRVLRSLMHTIDEVCQK